MDNGCSCNDCSTRLMKKLVFTTKPRRKPFKLVWIKDGGIVVNEQVHPFS